MHGDYTHTPGDCDHGLGEAEWGKGRDVSELHERLTTHTTTHTTTVTTTTTPGPQRTPGPQPTPGPHVPTCDGTGSDAQCVCTTGYQLQ
jgi:hypothetical protein